MIKFKKDPEATKQIKDGLVTHPDSSSLWKLYLNLMIKKTSETNESELIQLFHESIRAVKQKDSVELWQLIVNYCLLNNCSRTEEILKEGGQLMNQEISALCRLKYLNWALGNANRNEKLNGLSKVRQVYQS